MSEETGKAITTPDPVEDREFRGLLGKLNAPDTPPSLDRRVLDSFRRKTAHTPFWKRLFTTAFPMPIAAAVAIALLFVALVPITRILNVETVNMPLPSVP